MIVCEEVWEFVFGVVECVEIEVCCVGVFGCGC